MSSTLGHVVGIDYSMTCPCACAFDLNSADFKFENCKFLFQFAKDFSLSLALNVQQRVIPKEFSSPEYRWDTISNNVMAFVYMLDDTPLIGIEEYSFASRSNNNSQVGEHTGLLKHKLWKNAREFISVNITHVKMISGAEGGGNATKGQLLHKFHKDEPEAFEFLRDTIGFKITEKKKGDKVTEYVDSPVADIIDSYYLTKYTLGRYRGDIQKPVKKAKKKPKTPKKPS